MVAFDQQRLPARAHSQRHLPVAGHEFRQTIIRLRLYAFGVPCNTRNKTKTRALQMNFISASFVEHFSGTCVGLLRCPPPQGHAAVLGRRTNTARISQSTASVQQGGHPAPAASEHSAPHAHERAQAKRRRANATRARAGGPGGREHFAVGIHIPLKEFTPAWPWP